MKAEITKEGQILIQAETPAEAFALHYITKKAEDDDVLKKMGIKGPSPLPITFDCSVLNS